MLVAKKKGTDHKWRGLNNGNVSLSGLEVGSQKWNCFLRAEAGSEVDLALGLWRSISPCVPGQNFSL